MKNKIGVYNIIWKESLDSTNDYAGKYLSENKDYDKTVIAAYAQTSGRGQRDNKWESDAGKNITITILFKPTFVEACEQFRISELVSLGVYDYLSKYINNVKIKWPNDIYVNDNKIAGILIEHLIMGAKISSSICGIGLNINQDVFISDAPNPISLKQITSKQYIIESELETLLDCIDKRYTQLERNETESLREDYHQALYRRNEFHLYKENDNIYNGRIVGVNELGQLIIADKKDEYRTYNFKEVTFL